jgi:hypothetical protein
MNWKLKYTNQALKFLEKISIESIDSTIRKAIFRFYLQKKWH